MIVNHDRELKAPLMLNATEYSTNSVDLVRPVGAFERLFFRYGMRNPVHFTVIAEFGVHDTRCCLYMSRIDQGLGWGFIARNALLPSISWSEDARTATGHHWLVRSSPGPSIAPARRLSGPWLQSTQR